MIGLHTPGATGPRTGNKLTKVAYSRDGDKVDFRPSSARDDPSPTMTGQTNNRENPGFSRQYD